MKILRTAKRTAKILLTSLLYKQWDYSSELPQEEPIKKFCIEDPHQENIAIDIPHIIWTYWEENALPSLIQACLKSWQKHMPDFEIRILNSRNLYDFLPDFPRLAKNIVIANKSDLIRLMLLERYGGVWLDASIILQSSISNYIEVAKRESADLFAFYREETGIHPNVESWLLIAPRQSPLIKKWRELLMECFLDEDCQNFFKREMKYQEDYLSVHEWHRNYLYVYIAFHHVIRTIGNYKVCAISCFSNGYSIESYVNGNYHKFAKMILLNPKIGDTPSVIKIIGTARNYFDLYIKWKCYHKDSILGRYLKK